MRSSYTAEFNFTKYLEKVIDADTILYIGHVTAVKGLEIESEGPRSVLGEMCTIRLSDGTNLLAEVVGLAHLVDGDGDGFVGTAVDAHVPLGPVHAHHGGGSHESLLRADCLRGHAAGQHQRLSCGKRYPHGKNG